MRELALRWMEGLSEEWLLIYDNHPDSERLAPVLPRRNTGNVIYTSRSQGFLADLPAEYVCEVEPLSEEDAVNLLLRIAGRDNLTTDEGEMAAMRESVAAVGCLPLAIESVGAYLRKGDCTALTYLRRYRDGENRGELLSSPNADGSLPARPALYTALDVSYDAIESLARREGRGLLGTAAWCALSALNLLCFYHNEEIPVEMIARSGEERHSWGSHAVYPLSDLAGDDKSMDATRLLACTEPGGTWNDLHFNLGVQILQQFSLVKRSRNGGTISMHVMVQAWVQDRMDKATRTRQALAARVVLIESIKPGWNRLDQAWMQLLIPHFKACMNYEADEPRRHYRYEALLDFKLGWYYYQQMDFPNALEHLVKMLRAWKINTGGYSRDTTYGLSLLANVYHDMGRIGDAEAAYWEVLDRLHLRRDGMLDDLKARLAVRDNVRKGQVRRQKVASLLCLKSPSGKRAGAKKGEDQHHVAPDIHGLATGQAAAVQPAIRTLEQILEQIELGTASREPTEETDSEWDLEMGSVFAELARLLFESGRIKSAKKCLSKAIEVAKTDDTNDFQIWTWEDELIRHSGGADIDHWLQRYRAVSALPPDLREKLHGHEYSCVLPLGLAEAYLADDNHADAYEIYQSWSKRAPILYGPSDRKTLFILRAMALCASKRGFFEEGEEIARRAVETARTTYGQCHFETASCLDALATTILTQTLDLGPGSDFYDTTKEAYDSIRIAFGEGHPLAKKSKQRLEHLDFGNILMDDLDEEVVQGMKAGAFAEGAPMSERERLERASAIYREARREKCQAHDKLTAREKRKRKQEQLANANSEPPMAVAEEVQRATHRVADAGTPQPRRQWKGKKKANLLALSPIPEVELSFAETSGPEPPTTTEETTDKEQKLDLKGKGKALQAAPEFNGGGTATRR